MPKDEFLVSPQLQNLTHALESGNINALENFWQQVVAKGAPLIESIEDSDDHSLVTFLWRDESTYHVALISLLTRPSISPMTRFLDTDLWYKTCRVHNDARATYQFSPDTALDPGEERDDAASRWAKLQHDPLNPRTFAFFDDDEDPTGVKLTRSVLEMPAAPAQPWIEPKDGVPRGKVEQHIVRSEILGNERRVWVYTPPGYTPKNDASYGLLILFDGWACVKLQPTPTILDNLLAAAAIPPVVALLPDSLSLETRLRELILHPPFNDFLVRELVPWVRTHYYVASDPRQTVVGGTSAGGLAAAYAAYSHPEVFGNVLSQSGAFSFAPQGDGEYEWLARQFAESEKLPLRFYLDAGSLEMNSLRDRGDSPSLLTANRHLRNVLRAKGYEVHYAEFAGGHDYVSWRGTLSDGLQALLRIEPHQEAHQ